MERRKGKDATKNYYVYDYDEIMQFFPFLKIMEPNDITEFIWGVEPSYKEKFKTVDKSITKNTLISKVLTTGNIDLGILNKFNNSGSHFFVLILNSIVLEALVKSVAYSFLLVKFQIIHVSIVPKSILLLL